MAVSTPAPNSAAPASCHVGAEDILSVRNVCCAPTKAAESVGFTAKLPLTLANHRKMGNDYQRTWQSCGSIVVFIYIVLNEYLEYIYATPSVSQSVM
jgi:hypothetical protein